MSSQFFKDTIRWHVEKKGTTSDMPYFYYDNLSIAAVFTASTPKVRSLIPHADLIPMEFSPGRCLVAFSAFEYRKTDYEPYNEFAISFLTSYKKRSLPFISVMNALNRNVIPIYVWQLPVTTEAARAGGADLFGYPKFIATIEFSKGPEQISCVLSLLGTEILRFTGNVLPTKPGKIMRYISYTVMENTLLATNTLVNPLEYAATWDKGAATLEIGNDHAICQALRDIGLSKHPVNYQYSPRNEMILFAARNMSDI